MFEDDPTFPALNAELFDAPTQERLAVRSPSEHPPRFLMLYGSLRERSYNQLRVLGRWMRMLTIPNQSSVAKAFQEFTEEGRMKPSAYYDRVVDVMEELFKFTLLTRDIGPYLVDRYSERKETAEQLSKRVNFSASPKTISR